MQTPTPWHRIYFAAVGLFAVWVGVIGLAFPSEMHRAIPWAVPPLHARFLGAMYLAGAAVMFAAFAAKRLWTVRIVLPMSYIWMGTLGIVSFLHLDAFDYGIRQTWFWFFAYVVYPLAGIWLHWRYGGGTTPSDRPLPGWTTAWLGMQGIACTLLAMALLLLPTATSAAWPWPIPPLLAHVYSGPFLAYGVGALMVARAGRWKAARLPLLVMLLFAILVLVASIVHRGLFTPWSPGTVLWFGGFALAVCVMGLAVLAGPARGSKAA